MYKAYQTRVGNGPMPTELFGEDADRAARPRRRAGPGRVRRDDRPLAAHAAGSMACSRATPPALNGVTSVALTRLDVLSQFDTHQGLRRVRAQRRARDDAAGRAAAISTRCSLSTRSCRGWRADVSGVRSLGDLPSEARAYVRRIEQLIGAPIDMISVGPEREQAIVTHDIFGVEL